jgi:hypothetical protein
MNRTKSTLSHINVQFEKGKVKMAQTSTRRRNILIASLIVVVLVVSSVGAVIYLLTYDNVTVSGSAGVSGAVVIAPTIHTIEFQDTQTGTITTFHFTFAPKSASGFGNYSVTLKNGHTYNIYLSFSYMGGGSIEKEFITTFTVSVASGQTAITKNFGYPYFA